MELIVIVFDGALAVKFICDYISCCFKQEVM